MKIRTSEKKIKINDQRTNSFNIRTVLAILTCRNYFGISAFRRILVSTFRHWPVEFRQATLLTLLILICERFLFP
jgi:hypothetical protein